MALKDALEQFSFEYVHSRLGYVYIHPKVGIGHLPYNSFFTSVI